MERYGCGGSGGFSDASGEADQRAERKEQEHFRSDPEAIWSYIQSHIRFDPQLDYRMIGSTPAGCLRLQQGNPISQKILFVGICRTLEIPARINPVNLAAEYVFDLIKNETREIAMRLRTGSLKKC